MASGRRGAAHDDGGGIDGGGEATGIVGLVAEVEWVGVVQQVVSKCAAGDGSPVLGGEQEREHAAGPCELEAALGERDGDVGLRAEGGAGVGVFHDGAESVAKSAPCVVIEVVRTHPRWFADDEVEAAAGGGVAEVGAEVEVGMGAVGEASEGASQFGDAEAQCGEASALCGGEALAGAEEGALACEVEQAGAFGAERLDGVRGNAPGVVLFGGVDTRGEGAFPAAGASGIAFAQDGESRGLRDHPRVIECVHSQ